MSWYSDKTGCTSFLHTLKISPLSISFSYSYTGVNETRYFQPAGTFVVSMKDGTQVELGIVNGWNGEDEKGNRVGSCILSAPLDLSQVDYVQYGDHKIPVSLLEE